MIGLDYTGTTDPDTYTTNMIELDENGRYSDNMMPLSASNPSYEATGNSVKVYRDKSPDLDIY